MREKRIRVAVIGATGSVGASALDICAKFPNRLKVTALAAKSNAQKLHELAQKFSPKTLCLTEPQDSNFNLGSYKCLFGESGLLEIASDPEVDHVVFASSGTAAIKALQEALKADKDVSLANKESIVVAGPWVMPLVRRKDQLRPVDSEHSAIWQCLREDPARDIQEICLTASGGPFRSHTKEQMRAVKAADALKHPVWDMGAKVTIDSSTLMNKGIECIEAAQLFGLPQERVSAVVHPVSQAHGMVLFRDGTLKMLVSPADMRYPCAAALAWPDRLDLISAGMPYFRPQDTNLSFTEIDEERFPCFQIATEAGRRGGAYPALLIGADEAAVDAFLKDEIPYLAIAQVIEEVFAKWQGSAPESLDEAIALVDEGKRAAERACMNWRNHF